MADLEEQAPIVEDPSYDHLHNPSNKQPDQIITSIENLLLCLTNYTKTILCIILFLIVASCLMFSRHSLKPSVSINSLPASEKIASKQHEIFPKIESNVGSKQQQQHISILSAEIRSIINEIIDVQKPLPKQLKQLHDILIQKRKLMSQKQKFHKEKSQFFQSKSQFEYFGYLTLQKYNMQSTDDSMKANRKKAQLKQYQHMRNNYHIDEFPSEIPICMVVYASKTKKEYAYQYLLTSIFNQNYTNFKIVIVYDDTDQQSLQNLKTRILYTNSSKIELISNQQKLGYWKSLKNAINNNCNKEEVIALMKTNDQLLGFNVFSTFNAIYQQKNALIVYSNFIEYHSEIKQFLKGYSNKYSKEQISNYDFRSSHVLFGPLLTFKKKLFDYVKDNSIVATPGELTSFQVELALFFSLLELSCGEIEYIPEYYFLFEGYRFQNNKNQNVATYMKQLQSLQKSKCYKYHDLPQ